MKRDSEALKLRTKDFGLRVPRLYRSLPRTQEARILGYPASSLQHIDRCKLPSGVPRKVSG
jgi:hypothetical protein